MKRKLIHHSEMEYDYAFEFEPDKAPECGDLFKFGINHAHGICRFPGVAIVVGTESSSDSPFVTAYFEQHDLIQ